MVNILRSRVGVPYLVYEGEIVALTHAQIDDLVAIELMYPGALNSLNVQARLAVEELVGIDASASDVEWWSMFNSALAINELTTPLHVIAQARASVAAIQSKESS